MASPCSLLPPSQDEGGATAAVLTSLSSLVLMLQLIMNIANSNNNRKNENNNNNNDNNNNNINEGITLLLNEYTNEVMATGNGVGRELFTDDDFEVNEMGKECLSLSICCPFRIWSSTGVFGRKVIQKRRRGKA